MDGLFYFGVGIGICAIGYLLYDTFDEWYDAYRASLLESEYEPRISDDPQLTTPDCPSCKRNGKFVTFYIDPINKTGKYRQCVCGYIEDLPEDVIL